MARQTPRQPARSRSSTSGSWSQQRGFTGKLTPQSYNQQASAYQQAIGNTQLADGYYPAGVSGTERWKYDGTNIGSAPSIATNPAVAMRMGLPIDPGLVAAEIANRRGVSPSDPSVQRAVSFRIGNQLYRENVRNGLAEPGNYFREGGGMGSAGSWSAYTNASATASQPALDGLMIQQQQEAQQAYEAQIAESRRQQEMLAAQAMEAQRRSMAAQNAYVPGLEPTVGAAAPGGAASASRAAANNTLSNLAIITGLGVSGGVTASPATPLAGLQIA